MPSRYRAFIYFLIAIPSLRAIGFMSFLMASLTDRTGRALIYDVSLLTTVGARKIWTSQSNVRSHSTTPFAGRGIWIKHFDDLFDEVK
jgi:hypothetical protein